MANFKTIDEHLYKYIKGEVEKRFPQTCSFDSSSLGRGRLAIEGRWIAVKNNDWQLRYTSGKWTLGCTNKDIFPKAKSLLSTGKYKFDDDKKTIQTIGEINGDTYAQGEAAVLDELLPIIKTLQEISQGENELTTEPVTQDDGDILNDSITLNRWSLGELLKRKLEIN